MKTDLPKVARVLGGAMIEFVLDALTTAGVKKIVVVVGYRAEDVSRPSSQGSGVRRPNRTWLGTGHAVKMAYSRIKASSGPVIITIANSSPMIQTESVRRLLADFSATSRPACWGRYTGQSMGLGRIVRDGKRGLLAGVEKEPMLKTACGLDEYEHVRLLGPGLAWSLRSRRTKIAKKVLLTKSAPGLLLAARQDRASLADSARLRVAQHQHDRRTGPRQAKMKEMGYDKARR